MVKKGSKTAPKNFRPIPLLPPVPKIIKKGIHDQAQCIVDKNKIIYGYQSDFRNIFPADSCLSYLNNKIAKDFESCFYTAMILTDSQKAFDTVNHTTTTFQQRKWNLWDSLKKQQNGLNFEVQNSLCGIHFRTTPFFVIYI